MTATGGGSMRFGLGLALFALAVASNDALSGAYEDWRDAVASHRKGDHGTAIALYTRAIEAGTYRGKDVGQLYRMRGKAKLQKHAATLLPTDTELLESALADFTVSLKLHPSEAETYNERGAAYGMLKKHEQAAADFTKAIELRPSDFWPHNNRCLSYAELGRKEEAIKDCRKAAELDPKHWQPRRTLQRLGAVP